jgi:hypothetical protein
MRSKAILLAIGGSLLLALAVSCSNQQQTAEKKEEPAKAAAASQEATGLQFPLTGTVEETFDSGGYTYLRMKAADKEYWVATSQVKVKKGDEVTVPSGQMMQNFHSRTLNRTFQEIIFAAGLGGGENGAKAASQDKAASGSFDAALKKEGQQASAGSENPSNMMGSTKAVVPAADIKCGKAEGKNGYRVGDLFAQAAKLNGKEVEVRGKVMKVSTAIMGRNWIHLQDGTGDPQQNTHDLVVTSKSAKPEKGEVVTVKGVLHANKDFGSGYKYAAIVEDAEIVQPFKTAP